MKKLLAAALSGVLTAGIILGGTGLSTKAAETETETTGELTPIKVAASATPPGAGKTDPGRGRL